MHRTLSAAIHLHLPQLGLRLPHCERHTEKYRHSSQYMYLSSTIITNHLYTTRNPSDAHTTYKVVADDPAQASTDHPRLFSEQASSLHPYKEPSRDSALHPRRTSSRCLQTSSTASATYCTATEINITSAKQKLAVFRNLLLSPLLA